MSLGSENKRLFCSDLSECLAEIPYLKSRDPGMRGLLFGVLPGISRKSSSRTSSPVR